MKYTAKFLPPLWGKVRMGGRNRSFYPHLCPPPLRGRKSGLTLIELLVAICIASMVTLGIQQLLDTALTAWRVSVEEVTIGRLAEEVIQEMMDGNDEYSGVRDALEMIEAEPMLLKFVPMWVDTYEKIPEDGKFYLTKHLRSGTPPPICEIKFPNTKEFQSYPTSLHGDPEAGERQWVEFGFPIRKGSTVLVGYQPDVRLHPDLVMEYRWDAGGGKILRRYNRQTSEFALRREGIKIESITFTYFDGRNKEVTTKNRDQKSKTSLLAQISAVKISVELSGKEFKRTSSSLVNIRALGKSGQGILLSEGLELPLPDSEHIKILQIMNLTGVRDGNIIELKASLPNASKTWRLKLTLGVADDGVYLRNYEVYYPGSQLVVEHAEELSIDEGLDLLSLDQDGLYDLDDDEGVNDQVLFKGNEITLSVIRSEPDGAMVVIRP